MTVVDIEGNPVLEPCFFLASNNRSSRTILYICCNALLLLFLFFEKSLLSAFGGGLYVLSVRMHCCFRYDEQAVLDMTP